MKVTLTNWHETTTCAWCEKEHECVTADFGDGFIQHAALCWKCLQKAVKVRSRQERERTTKANIQS
jgi:hypothetical protein